MQEDATLSSTSPIDKSEQGNEMVSETSKCPIHSLDFNNTCNEISISTRVVAYHQVQNCLYIMMIWLIVPIIMHLFILVFVRLIF